MHFKTKTCLFLSVFFIFVLLYLLLHLLSPQSLSAQHHLIKQLALFNRPSVSFLTVIVLFVLLAMCITKLLELIYVDIRGGIDGTDKLGKCLLYEKLITEADLEEALYEQQFRFGEILLKERRITNSQLEEALSIQKHSKKRIGEILLELGYVEEGDIRWTLEKKSRRLGDILQDNHCVSEYDLQCVLTYQHFQRVNEK